MFDSPVAEIKDRLNILELIQDFVQLRKAGANYKGLCPFHSEKTPSFVVTPSKQMWYCFGCNLGGDIFEFIKKIENVDFPEALKILADRAGVELRKPTREEIQFGEKKNVLYEINRAAADYFAKVLWGSNDARGALEYLRNRGLTDQTVKNWQLGYAPDDFHYLENFLSKSFDKKDIELAGLIVKSDRNLSSINYQPSTYFDRFRGRIMFPIQNVHGQVVGFTGRLLYEKPDLPAGRQAPAKYVNSPETPIYSKSREIYGLYQGKTAIRKLDYALIVEGQMDVITSHQAGFSQTVASSGTAFALPQLAILKRFTSSLVFAFDSDPAGLKASERALQSALSLGFNVKIIAITGAKDPDELIRRGIGLWQKAINGAENYVDFMISQAASSLDLTQPENKDKIAVQIIPLINFIPNTVIRAHYTRKLAELLNISEKVILDKLQALGKPQLIKPAKAAFASKSRLDRLRERVLGLAIRVSDKRPLSQFQALDFGPLEPVYTAALTGVKPPELASQFDFLEFAVATEIEEQNLDPASELASAAVELKRLLFKGRMDQLSGELKAAEQDRNQALINKLSGEYAAIARELSRLNGSGG